MSNGYKVKMSNYILNEGMLEASSEGRIRSMQILRTGEFSDPRYGRFPITVKMLSQMVDNFTKGVRGVIPALDYKHDSEDIAAGWFKKLYLKGEELWADIEMTPKGEKVLSDKEFGYVSADFDTQYQDNESLEKFGCVLLGAGLTNRPVIKRMESVVQLSEEEKAVQDKIKKLIAEGKPQDQAVAIALEMQRQGKLSEGENTMDEKMKEMEAKLAELSAKLADSEKMCAEYKAKLAELEKKPEPAPAEEPKPELEVELAAAKKELAEAKGKLELAEKTSEFEKLLSEGKAVEAQRESFLKGDMKDFIAKSVPVKLSEQGHGGTPAATPAIETAEQAQEEVSKLARQLSEEKKISIKEAISKVLETNPKLAEKISG